MYKKVEKVICTDRTGNQTIIIFQKPISFPVYYVMKKHFVKSKNYGTIRPLFQE